MKLRHLYLERIKPWIGKPVIKVFTGMRRTGKSTLLGQIAAMILEQFPKQQTHIINLESLEWEHLRNYRALNDWVLDNTKSKKAALFIDEIQECDQWERAVNSLFATGRFDIYITGSNARLLSSEIATAIAGRYITLPVFGLSFKEYLVFREKESGHILSVEFNRYVQYGGFPGLHHFGDEEALPYLRSLYETILLRDVVERYEVRDVKQLERIIRFAFDNIGNLLSARSISNYLKSQHLEISVKTVQTYLGYLEACYAMYCISRYDVRGKRHLEINDKYYLGDIGLRHGILGFRDQDIAGILENIVCLELLRRGYIPSVGKNKNQEIDFIANGPQSKKLYIQVCYLLASQETINREFGALESVTDNYPKFVLSLDPLTQPQRNGIQWRYLPQFLLDTDW